MKNKVFNLIGSIAFSIYFFSICSNNSYAINLNINFEPRCESVLLFNFDTENIVYEKNPDKKAYPASLTKIMTYIIVRENVPDLDNTSITVDSEILKSLIGTGSSLSHIKGGDILTIRQLLHCLLIKSGNDAALILADFIGQGSIDNFVQMMNKKAKDLGCKNTNFVNAHGLDHTDHYSTAKDILKMTRYAITLPDFMEISSTVISKILGENRPSLITTNFMIDLARGGKYYYKYAKGIKTGYDVTSGRCLVSTASNNVHSYLCVALGGRDSYKQENRPEENLAMLDSKKIYQWAFSNLKIKEIANKNNPLSKIKVKLSSKKDYITPYPRSNAYTMLPKNINPSSVDVILNTPEYINAPIKENQKIGTATLKYENFDITTIDIVSNEKLEANIFLLIIHHILSSWFKIFIITAIFYILYKGFVRYSRIKKKTYRK